MAVLVTLTETEIQEAQRLAEATYERWKNVRGHYRNTKSSHRIGKLGEMAVEKWARGAGLAVESPFRDPFQARREDLRLGSVRVEVKTWAHNTWADMGRCVRPEQLPGLRSKADSIVWCSVHNDEVTIHGWSSIDEVARQPETETGPPHMRLANHQVPVEDLNPLETLS